MTKIPTQKNKRNLMAFEAPITLTDKARMIAEKNMVSTSAVCRQAVSQYINRYEADNKLTELASY
jgi:predicted transcriptional regulator